MLSKIMLALLLLSAVSLATNQPSTGAANAKAGVTVPPAQTNYAEFSQAGMHRDHPRRFISGMPVAQTAVLSSDTVFFFHWDTLTTQCTKLVVSNAGNSGGQGNSGLGGLNMNFSSPTECDTGANSRGEAKIYLYDGSPVVVRMPAANTYVGSWSMYHWAVESPSGFRLLIGFARDTFIAGIRYDEFRSGTFCTSDSLVKIEKSWYAPKGQADTCKFILERTRFFPYTIGQSVTNLAIGEAVDWDVPSDTNGTGNIGGYDAGRRMMYMRGFNCSDTVSDCVDNSTRYAGLALLYMESRTKYFDSSLYGGYNLSSDSFVWPQADFVPSQLWSNMQVPGYRSDARTTDLHSMLVYKNVALNGYTLPANDTLTVYSVLISIPTAASAAAGLDSLRAQYDRARKFLNIFGCGAPMSCCKGCGRGNVNCAGIVDLSDVSLLIAYLTATGHPTLPCPCAADANGDGRIDLADLSRIISYFMVLPKPRFAPC